MGMCVASDTEPCFDVARERGKGDVPNGEQNGTVRLSSSWRGQLNGLCQKGQRTNEDVQD